jgi:hypothetical protein
MLYVERNERGEIIAIRRDQKGAAGEVKEKVDEEIRLFLGENDGKDDGRPNIAALDTATIRVIDDIVELLVRKNLIMFSELPEAARDKLLARRRMRALIQDGGSIVDESEIL